MSKSRTYLRTTFSPEAQALQIELFTRNDGERHRSMPEHTKPVYYRFKRAVLTAGGRESFSWSPVKSSGTTNEAAAFDIAKDAKNRAELMRSRGRDGKTLSFNGLFSRFLASAVAAELSVDSRRVFKTVQATYARTKSASFMDVDVDDLERDDLVELVIMRYSKAAELRAHSPARQLTSSQNKLSMASLEADIRTLRRVAGWAATTGLLAKNTAILTAVPTVSQLPKSRLKSFVDYSTDGLSHNAIFSQDEVERIISVIDEVISQLDGPGLIKVGQVSLQRLSAARVCLATLMVCSFGVRSQELHKLKFDELNFSGSRYSLVMRRVSKTKTSANRANRLCFWPENQSRMSSLLKAIEQLAEEGWRSRGTLYVFKDTEPGPNSKNYYLRTLLEAGGLPLTRTVGDLQSRLTFTALRRTIISNLIDQGVSFDLAAEWHGTSREQVVASYRRTTATTTERNMDQHLEPFAQ